MHHGTSRRASRRRGAPLPPKRRSHARPKDAGRFAGAAGGFEALLPNDGSKDFFFSPWIDQPDSAAEYFEHGPHEPLQADSRLGFGVSAVAHVLILVLLLVEPSLGILDRAPEADAVVAEAQQTEPLILFMEEPQPPAPPAEVVPVPDAPVPPEVAEAPQPEPPPEVADNRLLIPKALLPPPEDQQQEFMNDLPFSEGNTEEFYTDEEVKDPGEEGEPEPTEAPEEAVVARETGEDDTFAEESEGSETGTGGAEAEAERVPSPSEVAELLFGRPAERESARPRADIRPPEPRPESTEPGEGGENGAFTDIRRFLAGARFDNPEGGLVANTDNTLYYNDKGADFVPWIRRMIAEVRRNWIVPYSISFNHGHVAIGISVARNGTVTSLQVLKPSGTSGFDNAAVGAIRAAQLLPLPADYPDPQFDIILVFWYNERPFDIFG